jgi:hypothetical protein
MKLHLASIVIVVAACLLDAQVPAPGGGSPGGASLGGFPAEMG